jgi:peptidoglycan/xylan/chitin deacetylase (PgdA/CDA1 family)
LKIPKWWEVVVTAMMVGAVAFGSNTGAKRLHTATRPIPRIIALTFDDGPSPTYTPQVLALLARYHAHATFFLLGSEVAAFPKIARDIVNQGSVVANHGYLHVNYFRVGVGGVTKDAERTEALLKKDHIPMAPFYRPPFGNSNKALVKGMSKRGYTLTLWSIDTRDWTSPGTSYITRKVLKDAEPGAIVLMHDSGGNRTQTIQALAAILPTLEAEGYRFVTLPQYVKDLNLKAPPKLPLPPPPAPAPAPVKPGTA